MRRRILYRAGKALERLGELLAYWPKRLEWFGGDLWDRNCDCEKCERRRNGDANKD